MNRFFTTALASIALAGATLTTGVAMAAPAHAGLAAGGQNPWVETRLIDTVPSCRSSW